MKVLGRAAVTLDDLKTFRQLGTKCPGHRSTAGPAA
jgi:transketolase